MKRFFLAAALLLCACAPMEQVHKQDPKGKAHFVADIFYPDDNVPLPYRSWLPEGKPEAIVVALHGFNDYSRAFIGLGTYFAKHHVAVYAYDQRGFGGSPYTGIWANEKNLVSDVNQFITQVSECYPGVPVYLLGESMGGAVAIDTLTSVDLPQVRGVILSAPAVWGKETMNPLYRSTLWMAVHSFPEMEFTGSDLKILASNNYPMLRRLSLDPMVIKKTRVDAVYGMVHLMDKAYGSIPAIKKPTLLLYGAKDQVIPYRPVDAALQRFTIPVDVAYYPDGYHMLLRDIQAHQVMDDVLSWMHDPKAPLPSGFGDRYVPGQN